MLHALVMCFFLLIMEIVVCLGTGFSQVTNSACGSDGKGDVYTTPNTKGCWGSSGWGLQLGKELNTSKLCIKEYGLYTVTFPYCYNTETLRVVKWDPPCKAQAQYLEVGGVFAGFSIGTLFFAFIFVIIIDIMFAKSSRYAAKFKFVPATFLVSGWVSMLVVWSTVLMFYNNELCQGVPSIKAAGGTLFPAYLFYLIPWCVYTPILVVYLYTIIVEPTPWSVEQLQKSRKELLETSRSFQDVLGYDSLKQFNSSAIDLSISSLRGKELLLYFTASRFARCHTFTSTVLENFYFTEKAKIQQENFALSQQQQRHQLNSGSTEVVRPDFEVVWISGDLTDNEFEASCTTNYHWPTLPWHSDDHEEKEDQRAHREALFELFDVQHLPCVVFMGADGKVVSKSGVNLIAKGRVVAERRVTPRTATQLQRGTTKVHRCLAAVGILISLMGWTAFATESVVVTWLVAPGLIVQVLLAFTASFFSWSRSSLTFVWWCHGALILNGLFTMGTTALSIITYENERKYHNSRSYFIEEDEKEKSMIILKLVFSSLCCFFCCLSTCLGAMGIWRIWRLETYMAVEEVTDTKKAMRRTRGVHYVLLLCCALLLASSWPFVKEGGVRPQPLVLLIIHLLVCLTTGCVGALSSTFKMVESGQEAAQSGALTTLWAFECFSIPIIGFWAFLSIAVDAALELYVEETLHILSTSEVVAMVFSWIAAAVCFASAIVGIVAAVHTDQLKVHYREISTAERLSGTYRPQGEGFDQFEF